MRSKVTCVMCGGEIEVRSLVNNTGVVCDQCFEEMFKGTDFDGEEEKADGQKTGK